MAARLVRQLGDLTIPLYYKTVGIFALPSHGFAPNPAISGESEVDKGRTDGHSDQVYCM